MSAPDTNTTKQTRRHRPVFLGIAAAVLAAILVILISANLGGGIEDDPTEASSDDSAVTAPGDPALAPAEPDAPWLGDPGETAPGTGTESGSDTEAPAASD